MSEHGETNKQIVNEFKKWLSEEGLTSKHHLQKLNPSIQDQLLNLTEDDIFISKPFEYKKYSATYIASVVTRYKCSDGTLGDKYMEPDEEYDPDMEFYMAELDSLSPLDREMAFGFDGYKKFDHYAFGVVREYIKEEFKRRHKRDLYNYPREAVDVSIEKMIPKYMITAEYPWRRVYAKIKSSNGESVYLLITHYNFETHKNGGYNTLQTHLNSPILKVYNQNTWCPVKVKKSLFSGNINF